jgi:hypothetical protein
MIRRAPALLAVLLAPSLISAANPRSCIGSVPIATFQVRITPPGGGAPLPIRLVNTITKGSKLACSPVKLPPDLKKNARIAVVVVPATTAGGDGVSVLDLRTLDGPTEWTIPFQVGVVLLVFGPQGLDEKRVNNLVSKDDDLVSELATYADQTEDLEDTIDALAAVEDIGDEDVDITPSRGSPSDQVLFALTRALNPVLTAYNPLGAGKKQGPATMAGKASDAFFENAGGFVPGGGALPVVKTWLMPDTEFRTVYTEPAATDALTLCAQRKTTNSRNRFVYLWAHRAVNSGPPTITLTQPAWLPIAARSTVPVKVKSIDEWPLVERVRDWTLAGGAAPVPVRVRSDQRRFLELDLRKTTLAPGTYRLEGKWDWGTVQAAGEFHLAALSDVSKIQLKPESQIALIDGRGVVPARFEGSDFQFVERATLRRAGRLGGTPTDLDYVLPVGPRAGPQNSIEVEIDTNHFRAGAYTLALAQTGGATQSVPVRVLPSMPRIENLPLRVNTGAKDLKLVLRGTDLEKIEGLTAEHATFRLGSISGNERELFVSLDGTAKKGDTIALQLGVGGVADAARLPGGIVVAGPRPRVAGVKVSPPDDLGTALREGELPAGSFVGMSIQVENADGPAALRLDCAEAAKTLESLRVRVGERRRSAKLDAVGDNALFASVDPGAVGTTGCTLQAAVDTESSGISEPVQVGRIVRLPRIESITLTNEKVDQGYAAVLKGWDLEAIEKTGWDAANGLAVPGPPRSLAGEGDRQTLRVIVPWPSPTPMAPLYVWLRGDKEGRAAKR